MPTSARQNRSSLVPRVTLLIVVVLVIVGFLNLQRIRDWASLYAYNPPQPVAELADETQMTDPARRVFYINHPALQDRDAFNASCSSRGEHTIVLGCYYPNDGGIFVFNVSDPRLDGVDQVTAAHEMLHAEYARLSKKERKHIDGLLQDYYDTKLNDSRVKAVIDTYKRTEPNDVPNEMHSVFGTEVTTLTPELETYYKNYFKDRSKVVAYADKYQAEFTSRQAQVAAYDSQLATMKSQIDTNSSRLKADEARINEFRSRMDAERARGDIDGYNSDVPLYNNLVDSYNTLISTTRGLITAYNDTVSKRNQLALQVTDLAHAIDSSFKPIKQ
jgi:hypothetical protein